MTSFDRGKPVKIYQANGWGVQSWTILAMVALGELGPIDAAIHADTRHESRLTYEFAARWGWIRSVTVQEGKAGGAISLDWFANKIRVKYKILADTVQGDEEDYTTAWASDTVSQGIYGIKELELELGVTTQTQAETHRAAQLVLKAQPRLKPALFAGESEEIELTIEAAGWFDTLGWRYYALDSGLIEYIIEGAGVQNLGDVAGQSHSNP